MYGNNKKNKNSGLPAGEAGFIALMSVLIISITLLGIAFARSNNGFFARFGALNSEYKRVGLGLAESCVNVALLKIAQNASYLPAAGGDTITVGSNTCTIKSVSYDKTYWSTSPYHEMATIQTQGTFNDTWSNLSVTAVIQNPSHAIVASGTTSSISIVSWAETP